MDHWHVDVSEQDLLSWKAQTLLLPGAAGSHADRPVLLVNPCLEQVMIEHTATGWRVVSLEIYVRAGLRPAVEGLLDTTVFPSRTSPPTSTPTR
ncbi:MAG: hypothetical protein M3308_04725 [Actinomycetota bacterium]|nr:hypothetical protein [Actinomycetota bacterium]